MIRIRFFGPGELIQNRFSGAQYSVGTPKWVFWEKSWQKNRKTTLSPLSVFFWFTKKTLFFFWWLVIWMLHIGRTGHPGPGSGPYLPGQLSIEFINVGGWG